MKRKAIILDARKSARTESECWNDVSRFRDLLLSSTGGAWLDSEVLTTRATTAHEVIDSARSAEGVDFSLLVYLGAGTFGKRERPWPEVEITLPSGEALSEREINPGTPRCLAIFDLTDCYEPTEDWLPENQPSETAASARRRYFAGLSLAEAGLVRVIGRVASPTLHQERSFIASLLRAAKSWRESGSGVLQIDAAVEKICAAAEANHHFVAVNYLGGRRLHHFPFFTA